MKLAVTAQRLPVGFTCDDDVPEPEWHTPGRHVLLEARESFQTWADVATEQMSDAAAYYSKLDGYGTSGAISVVMTKTGLTPDDPYEFRLNFRKDSSVAAVSLSFAGSASAVGS